MYVDVLKEFKETHPDFVGSKFVYAPIRAVNDETFSTYLPIMVKLQRLFPNFIAGFDLVGQEDRGKEKWWKNGLRGGIGRKITALEIKSR